MWPWPNWLIPGKYTMPFRELRPLETLSFFGDKLLMASILSHFGPAVNRAKQGQPNLGCQLDFSGLLWLGFVVAPRSSCQIRDGHKMSPKGHLVGGEGVGCWHFPMHFTGHFVSWCRRMIDWKSAATKKSDVVFTRVNVCNVLWTILKLKLDVRITQMDSH